MHGLHRHGLTRNVILWKQKLEDWRKYTGPTEHQSLNQTGACNSTSSGNYSKTNSGIIGNSRLRQIPGTAKCCGPSFAVYLNRHHKTQPLNILRTNLPTFSQTKLRKSGYPPALPPVLLFISVMFLLFCRTSERSPLPKFCLSFVIYHQNSVHSTQYLLGFLNASVLSLHRLLQTCATLLWVSKQSQQFTKMPLFILCWKNLHSISLTSTHLDQYPISLLCQKHWND